MDRVAMIEKYGQQYAAAPEKSLEWMTARDVYGFITGPAPLSWVIEELRKVQERFCQSAQNAPYATDSEYGTYATYCHLRIDALETAIGELEAYDAR